MVIFLLTCLTTATLALFCSTLFRKTTTSLIATYSIILLLYLLPVAANYFGQTYFPATRGTEIASQLTIVSPFATAVDLPIAAGSGWTRFDATTSLSGVDSASFWRSMINFGWYAGFTLALNCLLMGGMIWMFNSRWRVASMPE
jgi:ABC-type transport system involved in multi-copper enzyme maturation permease subunit